MEIQQGGGNVLGAGSSTVVAPRGRLGDDGDDDNDESGKKRDSDLMEKVDDKDKIMEEAEKEIEIQDSTPPKQLEPS